MYSLVQGVKIHEYNISEEEISDILDGYDSLFHNLGFNTVVSVSNKTKLPNIKIIDNKRLWATLSFRKDK